jgi:glycosyltransferase involved in cell wall biosynthesis
MIGLSKQPTLESRVSVLVACFNAEKWIGQAIQSVLNQTHTNLELIIVNDGSTDKSAEIISSFKDDRILLVSTTNRGASKARNLAFENSSGEYVIFFDADDLLALNHLQELVKEISNTDNSVAFAPLSNFIDNPSPTGFEIRPSQRDCSGPDWLISEWMDGYPMMQSGMFLLPRHLIVEHGGWDIDLTLDDDFEMFARLLSKVEKMIFAPNARIFYRRSVANSLSSQKSKVAIRSSIESIRAGVKQLLSAKDTPEARLACANILQKAVYDQFPRFPSEMKRLQAQVNELGGADILPHGPPMFDLLWPIFGWRFTRLLQKAWNSLCAFVARSSPGR